MKDFTKEYVYHNPVDGTRNGMGKKVTESELVDKIARLESQLEEKDNEVERLRTIIQSVGGAEANNQLTK